MARSTQQQLDALDEAIAIREAGDLFERYSTEITQWAGAALKDMYAERRRLQNSINSSGGRAVHIIRANDDGFSSGSYGRAR